MSERDVNRFGFSSDNAADLARMALLIVGAAALVWLLRTGTPIFQPFALALVIGIIFAPLSDLFLRWGAHSVAGALLVLLIVLSLLSAGVFIFYPVAAEFLLRLPLMWIELQDALSGVRETMESVESAQNEVAETLDPNGGAPRPESGALTVPSVSDLLAFLPSIGAQILTFVGTLYFFLLTRTEIYETAAQSTMHLDTALLCRAEAEVSRYFLAVTAINAGFGVLVALMLSGLGMPNAVYWGFGAFLVNYILYLGPISFALVLVVAGLIVFDGPMSFAPALAYLAMNMTEGQFVTPSLVGRHMSVNPLLIFMSLVFWMWMWGPLGAIIAIPLLVWMRQVVQASKAPPVGVARTVDALRTEPLAR